MGLLRLSLNLIHFFQDYRQLSKICVTDDITTIKDLENYIAKVFHIDTNFYLMTKSYYLPSSQSIKLLDDNDLVYVIPNLSLVSNSEQTYVEFDETKHKKKKKKLKKQKNKSLISDTNNEISDTNNEILCNNVNSVDKTGTELNISEKNPNNFENDSEMINNIENDEISNKTCEERPNKRQRCSTPINTQEKSINAIIVQSIETITQEKQQKLISKLSKTSDQSQQRYGLDDIIDFGSKSPLKPETNEKSKMLKEFRHSFVLSDTIKDLISQKKSYFSDGNSSQNNSVTKRRNRVRKRKKKQQEIEENQTKSLAAAVFRPPKSIASPKTHIKFSDDENDAQNGFENGVVHSDPEKKIHIVQSAPENADNNKAIVENVSIKNNNNISLDTIDLNKFVDLSEVPSINNLIIFKKLKLDENYVPSVSKLILAEVKEIISDGEQLKMKIINGYSEFKEPLGRFSCIFEEKERNSSSEIIIDDCITIVNRMDMIEPKIFQE